MSQTLSFNNSKTYILSKEEKLKQA